eukprot:TRINITY_DN1586_c0_g1_i2.p1 TRINITY_DN1586_c0_g1~~TRINITY_DN1586_c0_g1_i2.p1  ORF type:complete len:261 (-),score=52.08 TRINITY_DN1586_c0_g1_i2:65-847(-)
MEDEFLFYDNIFGDHNSCIIALFDGHGGRETVENIIKNFKSMFESQGFKEHLSKIDELKELFSRFFQQINFLLKADEERMIYETCGATGTIILIYTYNNERRLHIANIGDSECFLFDDEKISYPLTYKHKATDDNEKKRILDGGGIIQNNRINSLLMISRAFGDLILENHGVLAEPAQENIKLRTGFHYLVLASDGLWDVFNDKDEIGTYLDQKKKTEDIAEILVNLAKMKGSRDNISVFVMQFSEQTQPLIQLAQSSVV